MNTNRKILELLAQAPESQLSERFRKKCEEFSGTEDELLELFTEIHNGCCESSSFIKATVNPKFTSKYVEV